MVFKKYQSAYEKHWQKIAREIKKISDFGAEDFKMLTSPSAIRIETYASQ